MSENLQPDNPPFDIWFKRHIQVALSCLGHFSRHPMSFFFTSAVIGIALFLPASLNLLVKNIESLSQNWELSSSITVYLKHDLTAEQTNSIHQHLKKSNKFKQVTLISPSQAMEEFKTLSGFAEALDILENNPLPAIILIDPITDQSAPEKTQQLINELKSLPEVELVEFDMQWLKRFYAITNMAQRSVIILGSMLGLAVLLIIGNTIRLEIQNRQSEIEITQLVGATNSFIRRPFLYTGFWYGFAGGVIGWIFTSIAFLLLKSPVNQLSQLYNSPFNLMAFDFTTSLVLLLSSSILGLIGAWIAVGRHLNLIEPV